MLIDLNTTDLGRIVHALSLQRDALAAKRGVVPFRDRTLETIDELIERINAHVATFHAS